MHADPLEPPPYDANFDTVPTLWSYKWNVYDTFSVTNKALFMHFHTYISFNVEHLLHMQYNLISSS